MIKNPRTETSFSKTNQNLEKVPPVSSTINACTEDQIPPLVTNDSNKTSMKVNIASKGPKITYSFFFLDITEVCSNVVIDSQGNRPAVSTGSHAQYPPHPNVTYAQ